MVTGVGIGCHLWLRGGGEEAVWEVGVGRGLSLVLAL